MMKRILILIVGFFLFHTGMAQKPKGGISEKQRMDFDRHYFGGMKEKMIQNYDGAESEFRQAIQIDPLSGDAHYQLSTVLMTKKRGDEALFEAEKAFKYKANNVWYARYLIELYKNNKSYDQAAGVCEKAYKANPDIQFLYELQGLYLYMNKPSKALGVLNEIEKREGIKENTSRQKEEIYLSAGKVKKAIEEIKKLCAFYPDQLTYQGLLADLYMRSGAVSEGVILYKNIQAKEPRNGLAAFSLADYYHSIRDTQQYFEQLQMGMKSSLEPKLKMQVLQKIIPSRDFGSSHREKCMQLAGIFAETNPSSSSPYVIKGDLLLLDRSMEEARKAYLKATSINANEGVAWEQIIFCDQDLKRNDYLMEDCARLTELFPDYSVAYLYYGMACVQLKKYDEGVAMMRKGLEFSGGEEMQVQMLINMGDLANGAKLFELSDSCYEAALAWDPKNSFALNNYAYYLSLRNIDLEKAANMSKLSIELDPKNPSNLDTYGWILYQQKKYELAEEFIGRSLEISPNNAEVIEHLGDVNFRLGKKEEAIKAWQKAKQLGGDSQALDEKIKTGALPNH